MYWRRRAVAVGLVVVVLFVLSRACGSDGDPSTLSTGGSPTPTVTTDPSPSATGQPTGQPTVQASGTSSAAVGDCPDSAIKVEAVASERVYAAEVEPTLTIKITNISGAPCRRDIGPENREILVYSGADRVWSNRDCNPQTGKRDVTLLKAAETRQFRLNWSRTRSAKGCPTPRPKVDPGTYRVSARLGTITVQGDVFSLR